MICLPVPCHSQDRFTVSFAPTYLSGDYGQDENTQLVYLPLTAKYRFKDWKFRLTIPYLVKRGPRNVIVGIGTINESQQIQTTTESGLGDIIASVDYRVYYHPKWRLLVDLRAKVEFGTADASKSLGTGKTDFIMRTGIYKMLGNWTVYSRLGYKIYGTTLLNNVIFASGGLTYQFSKLHSAGLDFFWRDRLVDNIAQHRVLTTHATQRINQHWKIQEYVLTGFGDRSPDWGLGINLGYIF